MEALEVELIPKRDRTKHDRKLSWYASQLHFTSVHRFASSPALRDRIMRVADNVRITDMVTLGPSHRGARNLILVLTAPAVADEHLFAILLGTGLRIGEALGLRWSDVDLDQEMITVRRALERLRGRPWRLSVPKSESGKRLVPLIGPTAWSWASSAAASSA